MDKISMAIIREAIENLKRFQLQNAELDAEYSRHRSREVIARLGMEARSQSQDAGRDTANREGQGPAQPGEQAGEAGAGSGTAEPKQ